MLIRTKTILAMTVLFLIFTTLLHKLWLTTEIAVILHTIFSDSIFMDHSIKIETQKEGYSHSRFLHG